MHSEEGYPRYRQKQINRILDAAETCFFSEGLLLSSIDGIAKEAGLTRKTVYQYFQNKEELVQAVLSRFDQERKTELEQESVGPEKYKSGYALLLAHVLSTIHMYERHPQHLRLIAEFETLISRRKDCPGQSIQQYRSALQQFSFLIRLGIQDGSIRADVVPETAAEEIMNLMAGMTNRFSLMRDGFSEIQDTPAEKMMKDLFTAALKGLLAP